MIAAIVLTALAAQIAGGAPSTSTSSSCSEVPYVNRNQVDLSPLVVARIAGDVTAEVGTPAKQLGPIPACLAHYTEGGHVLVATTTADVSGRFRFDRVKPGRYRLLIIDQQRVFCIANTSVTVQAGTAPALRLHVHLRPTSVDTCSYTAYK